MQPVPLREFFCESKTQKRLQFYAVLVQKFYNSMEETQKICIV